MLHRSRNAWKFFLAALLFAGLQQVVLSSDVANASSTVRPGNIGHSILDLESAVPGRSNVKVDLDRIIRNAVRDIERSGVDYIADERMRAAATFNVMARSIRNEGYSFSIGTYPHSFTEMLSSKSRFFDCDTGSFLFLSIADELNLPVSIVEVENPDYSPAREFGDHSFVRWTLPDGSTVDWDPNSESQRSGDEQSHLYGFAWSEEQLIGYVFFLRGLDWEKLGKFEKAVSDYEQSIERFPAWTKAKNNMAWLLASRSELQHLGRQEEALALAKEVVAANPVANNRDTLACTYALIGDFESAIKIQKTVVASNPDAPSFSDNLGKMLSGENCFVDH